MSELIYLDHRSLMQFSFLMMLSISLIISGYILTGNRTKNIVLLNIGNLSYTLFFFTVSVDIAIPLRSFPEIVALLDLTAVIFWAFSLRETMNQRNPYKWYLAVSIFHVICINLLAKTTSTVSLLRMTTSLIIAVVLLLNAYIIIKNTYFKTLESYRFTSFTLILYTAFKVVMGSYRMFSSNFESSIFSIETSINIFTFISLIFAIWINLSIMFLNYDVKRKEVENYSMRDHLTKLPNRKLLSKQFSDSRQCAKESSSNFTVALLDIDDFKCVNDEYGHNIGDEVLVDFAEHMSTIMRESDFISRYGGEEFLVILSTKSVSEMTSVIDRILIAVRNQKYSSLKLGITISIGAIYVDHKTSDRELKELTNAADANLYQAKSLGKDRAVSSVFED